MRVADQPTRSASPAQTPAMTLFLDRLSLSDISRTFLLFASHYAHSTSNIWRNKMLVDGVIPDVLVFQHLLKFQHPEG